jgi:hypothetical protein
MAGSALDVWQAHAGPVTLDQTIAGHRVLRLLATGTRSRVWLAPDDKVLKVISGHAVAGEALALHRARGDHVVSLLDAAVDDDGAVLVFPRLPRGSLAEVMAGRAGLDAGEAVTVLAPISAALARMHAAGVAHADLSAAHVLFRADGAPMLIGFGSAQVFEGGLPEVALERIEGVVADRAALAELAAAVLARVTGPRSAAADTLAESLRHGSHSDLESRLGRELFELAAARPVRLEPDAAAEANPRRAVGIADLGEPQLPDAAPGQGPWRDVLGAVLETGPGRLMRSFVRERWQGWSPRQRKIAVAAAAAAAVLAVAFAAVPAAPEKPASVSDQPIASESPDPNDPDPDDLDAGYAPSAVTGDDPLAALGELLPRRAECFRDLSALCLDDVDEQGSAALDDDRAALDALVADGVQPQPLEAVGATIVERLGDSVLIALAPGSEPASVLLLKGEAGWRIRDFVAGGAAG